MADIVEYQKGASIALPTYPAAGNFLEFEQSLLVGHGSEDFESGRSLLQHWAMHEKAGVSVLSVRLEIGETVVMWTRPLGVWLMFACRITDVVDTKRTFGLTYVTLPDHPEQGWERFTLELGANDDLVMKIHAISRPATLASRLTGPVGRVLQRRYTARYLNSMRIQTTRCGE